MCAEKRGSDRPLVACEAVICTVLLVAFIVARDLPMVDLPQHAAQIATWVNAAKPEYHSDQFVLNLRTPYLSAYLLARLLASTFGVLIALKIVVWLSVGGQILGLHFLCKRLGHDPWLALLGLPLALGYSFLFGFVSYIAALPLLYLCVGLATTYASRPTLARGTALVVSVLAVLVTHGIAFAQTLLFVGPLLLLGNGSAISRALPLVVPIAAAVAWLVPGPIVAQPGNDLWMPSLRRLLCLPGLLVGTSEQDIVASVYGALVLLTLSLALGQPTRDIRRWLPLAFVVCGFCAGPTIYRGYGPIWPRFAVLVVPATLLAFRSTANATPRAAFTRRAALFATALVWTIIFSFRLAKVNRETSSLHQLIDDLPSGLRVRPVVFEAESRAFPDLPIFTHLPAHYLVEKGGTQGYSFAMYPSSVIRYRKGIVPKMSSGQEWEPEAFRIGAELNDYDCFMVHSATDRYRQLFGEANGAVHLCARAGDWWSYCARND